MSRSRAAALAAALLAAAACGRDDALAREVRSPLYAAPLEVEPARTVALPALVEEGARELAPGERLLSLGAVEGAGRVLFGEVADVAVRPSDGTLFVLDRLERTVRVFSAQGRPLYQFGREGNGPGEFQNPTLIEFLPWSGEVAVWDARLLRLTIASAEGQVRRTVPLQPDGPRAPEPQQGWSVRRLRATPRGFVVERRDPPLRVAAGEQRGYLLRLDTAASRTDTVFSFPVAQSTAQRLEPKDGVQGAGGRGAPRLAPEPRWDVLGDGGVALAPGGPYAVYYFGADGGAELAVERPWEAAAVTRDDRLHCWRAIGREAAWAGRPMLPAEELDRRNPGGFAAVRPAITGLLADGGRVWVRRFDGRGYECGKARTWDAYDRAGRHAATVSFPAEFRPLRVAAGRAYGARRDSLGVWYLDVYPIP